MHKTITCIDGFWARSNLIKCLFDVESMPTVISIGLWNMTLPFLFKIFSKRLIMLAHMGNSQSKDVFMTLCDMRWIHLTCVGVSHLQSVFDFQGNFRLIDHGLCVSLRWTTLACKLRMRWIHLTCARSLTAVNLQWRSKKTSFGLLVLEDNIIRFSMPCTLENSSSGLLFVAPLWPSVFDQSANGASVRVQLHHASH